MIELAVLVALATLAVGLVVAIALRQLPTVRLQLAGLALLAVVLPLAVVLLSGWVMFHMGDDVKILAVAAASASTSVVVALLVSRLDRARDRGPRRRVAGAGGRRPSRPRSRGRPAELVQLARSFNEMADNPPGCSTPAASSSPWASHDLRTPIASLQAMLEAVEDGLAEPERYLPAMLEQVRILAQLVEDLFELARIDAGVLRLELREAELVGLIESCIRGVEAEARARNVSVEARAPDRRPGQMRAGQVQRVLYNLLANAVRHTPSRRGGRRPRPVGDRRGAGSSSRTRATGRRPRRRAGCSSASGARTGARTSGGAGLGLAIARGLVEAHGGRIWAETRPEGGTRVSFTLPSVA